jgi:predicted TIM-barrel fold metal-dependent hydrolase
MPESFLTGSHCESLPASARPRPADLAASLQRIDCQSHLYCPAIVDRMESRATDPVAYRRGDARYVRMGDWLRKVLPNHSDVDAKLRDMDAAGIAMAALSANDPGPEWFEEDAPAVARTLNDYIGGVARAHPTRFFALCVPPLPFVPASLAEIDRCLGEYGMKGLLLYTNLAGRFPDELEFRPIFARAAELDLPILLHPAMPLTIDAVKGYELTSTLGNMFENTIALARIIAAGILDEFPDLNLVCPHLGGTLPYIVGRLDHQVGVLKRGPQGLRKAPSEYLKQIYFDVVSPLPLAMKFAYDFFGPEKLLFASDHPWVDPRTIASALESLQLPPEHEALIFSGNARKLFKV